MTIANQRNALVQRIESRIACEGKIVLPAVPGMVDDYLERCDHVFASLGRRLNEPERVHLRKVLAEQLNIAFSKSQRSTVTVSYSADIAMPLRYFITAQFPSLSATYEHWIATRQPPYFGQHPDAKVMALVREVSNPVSCPVLDIGAGTGRNSFAIARLGHPVDAVELTAGFADVLRNAADKESLEIRVICKDIFQSNKDLRNDYGLVVVSEVVSDFRSVAEWRALLGVASHCLRVGGKLLVNAFVTQRQYFTDPVAVEFAQQVYSYFVTPSEIDLATNGLSLKLVSTERVYDFEKTHLRASAWPPTPWYAEWVSGQDIFSMPKEESPVAMMWLVFEKTEG